MHWAGAVGTEGADAKGPRPADVLLVCCAGGHLLQLYLLREAWASLDAIWVTHPKDDARSLLEHEEVVWAHGPTVRNVPNLFRNLALAWTLLRRVRPSAIVTTGAGIAVPFAWLGRALGCRVVYVESLTRIDRPSLTGRLIAPIANRVYVQWPELKAALPRAVYAGSVLGSRCSR